MMHLRFRAHFSKQAMTLDFIRDESACKLNNKRNVLYYFVYTCKGKKWIYIHICAYYIICIYISVFVAFFERCSYQCIERNTRDLEKCIW